MLINLQLVCFLEEINLFCFIVNLQYKYLILFTEYFKKQGFTQDVRISKKIHQEYIKHYQGAILMHCELNPKIIYTQLTSVIRLQKEV